MIKRSLLLSLLLAATAAQAQDKAAAQPDMAKAKQTAEQVCAACHGADGNSQIPANPKLAGQHAEYLLKQLRNFKSQDGKPAERVNGIMGGMVAALSDDDMKGLAAHFASQEQKPESAKNKASIELGQRLWRAGDLKRGIPACAACHGPSGHGVPGPTYPRLAGQHAQYTADMLRRYRSGEVHGRGDNANAVMSGVAQQLTDQEIEALATYIEGLHEAPATAAR